MDVREVGPDTLVVRPTGGWLARLSIGILFCGLTTVLQEGLGWLDSRKGGDDGFALSAVVLFGVAAVAAFLLAAVRTIDVTFDRANGSVSRSWGLGVPFRTTRRALAGFREVRVTKEERLVVTQGLHVHAVQLTGGGKPFTIDDPRAYDEARQIAARVAAFLRLPLVDRTTEPPVRRRPDEIGESLRNRTARTGENLVWPEPPPELRCTYQVSGDSLRIEIPPTGLSLGLCFGSGIVALFTVMVIRWLHGTRLPDVLPARYASLIMGLLSLVIFLLPTLPLGMALLRIALRRTLIDASPRELRVTWRGIGEDSQTIPTDELEELVLVTAAPDGGKRRKRKQKPAGRPELVARSDRQSITLASGLERPQAEWIRDAVLYVVTGKK